MPKSRRKKTPALAPSELRKQDAVELPDRHAMSLLSGMPSLGGADLLGGTDGTAPEAGSTTPTDSTPSPTTSTTSSPIDKLDKFGTLAPVSIDTTG